MMLLHLDACAIAWFDLGFLWAYSGGFNFTVVKVFHSRWFLVPFVYMYVNVDCVWFHPGGVHP